MKSVSIKDILVIQLTKMGDFLQTTPLLYGIKQKYPSARLSVLIDTRCVEVASGVPFIDHIIPFSLTSLRQKISDSQFSLYEKHSYVAQQLSLFKMRHFDIVYNINFSKITALLCEFFKDSKIIGYRLQPGTHKLVGKRWASFIFHLMRHRNMLRFNLVDLLASYEYGDYSPCPELFFHTNGAECIPIDLPTSEDSLIIGLQMGCGGTLRQWPVDYFTDLAHRLVQDLGFRVVLFGSKEERHLGKRFKDEWFHLTGQSLPPDNVIDLIGKTTISQLAAALKRCSLLISGDTGTMHLATAVGTRVLALFMGTALCYETGPYGEGHFVLQTRMPCYPCIEGDSPCQRPVCRRLIHPEMVSALVSHILKKNDMADLLNNECVQIYRTSLDEWGVKFVPLIKEGPDVREIMAVAYREVGRKLMRPTYQIDPQGIMRELSSYYGNIEADTQRKVNLILASLSSLRSICELGIQEYPHISYSDIEMKIQERSGSLDVLTPLYGYFRDLKANIESHSGTGNGIATQKVCKAMLIPVKDLFDLIEKIGSALPCLAERRTFGAKGFTTSEDGQIAASK